MKCKTLFSWKQPKHLKVSAAEVKVMGHGIVNMDSRNYHIQLVYSQVIVYVYAVCLHVSRIGAVEWHICFSSVIARCTEIFHFALIFMKPGCYNIFV